MLFFHIALSATFGLIAILLAFVPLRIFTVIIPRLAQLIEILVRMRWNSFWRHKFGYNYLDDFERKVDWNPNHIQFISAETGRKTSLLDVDEVANQVAHWLTDLCFQNGSVFKIPLG